LHFSQVYISNIIFHGAHGTCQINFPLSKNFSHGSFQLPRVTQSMTGSRSKNKNWNKDMDFGSQAFFSSALKIQKK